MIRRILVLLSLVFLLPLAAQAQYFYQSDGGYLELQAATKKKLKKQKIFFVWIPHYPANTVTYQVFARCSRISSDNEGVGKNKVIFQNIVFSDGISQVNVKKLSGKMKDGDTGFMSREVPELAVLVASGEAVVAEVTVLVKKLVNAFDIVTCQADATETPAE